MADSLILMVLALVVFGPRRLPQIGRQIGKLMYEFRKASNDFKFQMEEELRNSEDADRRRREEAERQQRLALAAETTSTEASSTEANPTETSPTEAVAQQASPYEAAPYEAAPSEAVLSEAAPYEAGQYEAGQYEAEPHEAGLAEVPQPDASPQAALPEPAAAGKVVEATYPRILPPSTGEQVAAIRPGTVAPEPTPAAPPETDSAQIEAAADQHGAVTEPAAHNG
ncbi:MAG TPA: twin-arginine translocase TatA/TatE family subunit [Terracidiphilus sp.]|jgi:sec-independent protein translocase protein TatB|nr:twin-arginine translocase TatA/TatE family subunit [Terracidiphilus sp.]